MQKNQLILERCRSLLVKRILIHITSIKSISINQTLFLFVKKDSNFLLKFASRSLAGAIGSTAGNQFYVGKKKNDGIRIKKFSFINFFQKAGLEGLQVIIMRAKVLNRNKMACHNEIRLKLLDNKIVKSKGLVTWPFV